MLSHKSNSWPKSGDLSSSPRISRFRVTFWHGLRRRIFLGNIPPGQGEVAINRPQDPLVKNYLALKRASASRPSGEWSDDDYDVLADGELVGRIFLTNAAPVGASWMWTLLLEHHKDRTPTHGYAETREAAIGGVRQELAAGVT
jgi:hypothetical protein